MEELLLVNEKDEIIGAGEKVKCHQDKGILHRAFTVFVFNDSNDVLLQKRSGIKMLWPLCWDTSCSGHPLKGETYEGAAERRIKEEFGFTLPLKVADKFQYHVSYKDLGAENELCATLIGRYNNEEIKPDQKEIAEWQWIQPDKLKEQISRSPQAYAPWLGIALERILSSRLF